MSRKIVIFFETKKYQEEEYTTLNRLGEWLDAMLENKDIEQISILRKEVE